MNRIATILANLKKHNINRPDATVIERISRSERLLEVGCATTDLSYSTYQNVKDTASSETKSYIGSVLGMKLNGVVFEDFPFILSARQNNIAKLVKILRVADGASPLESRQKDVLYEMRAAEFVHTAIVPTQVCKITVDGEISRIANCRIGENDVLIMPWYQATLNKYPSSDLAWIAEEGVRIMDAVAFVHSKGYVHMDIKAMNVFVNNEGHWFIGDFGSCKPINEPVTSSTFQFCYENVVGKPAIPKYDWFMLLLMILTEALED